MNMQQNISCTLTPQGKVQVLLPNGAVEEITRGTFTSLSHPATGSIPVVGYTQWRDKTIAAISLCPLNPGLTEEMLFTIVRLPQQKGFIAFIASSMPRTLLVNHRNIEENSQPEHIHPMARSHVVINGAEAIIPDLLKCYSTSSL